jgi:hypothetical protein
MTRNIGLQKMALRNIIFFVFIRGMKNLCIDISNDCMNVSLKEQPFVGLHVLFLPMFFSTLREGIIDEVYLYIYWCLDITFSLVT